MTISSLLALHIADGVLTLPWLTGGFVLAALLCLFGAWRMREEEIAPTAVLTGAFFVASLIHIRLGPTSVHLLLSGLLGVVLGRRAGLSIFVALSLQALLMGHGGLLALGVNTCVMAVPALLIGNLYPWLQKPAWVRHRWFQLVLVGASSFLWLFSAWIVVGLLVFRTAAAEEQLRLALDWSLQPWALLVVLLASGLVVWGFQRLHAGPEFPLGLLLGEVAVLFTVLLNGLVLMCGAHEDARTVVLLAMIAHLPLAVVEGIVLGFAVGFLAQVKPSLLRRDTVRTVP